MKMIHDSNVPIWCLTKPVTMTLTNNVPALLQTVMSSRCSMSSNANKTDPRSAGLMKAQLPGQLLALQIPWLPWACCPAEWVLAQGCPVQPLSPRALQPWPHHRARSGPHPPSTGTPPASPLLAAMPMPTQAFLLLPTSQMQAMAMAMDSRHLLLQLPGHLLGSHMGTLHRQLPCHLLGSHMGTQHRQLQTSQVTSLVQSSTAMALLPTQTQSRHSAEASSTVRARPRQCQKLVTGTKSSGQPTLTGALQGSAGYSSSRTQAQVSKMVRVSHSRGSLLALALSRCLLSQHSMLLLPPGRRLPLHQHLLSLAICQNGCSFSFVGMAVLEIFRIANV